MGTRAVLQLNHCRKVGAAEARDWGVADSCCWGGRENGVVRGKGSKGKKENERKKQNEGGWN